MAYTSQDVQIITEPFQTSSLKEPRMTKHRETLKKPDASMLTVCVVLHISRSLQHSLALHKLCETSRIVWCRSFNCSQNDIQECRGCFQVQGGPVLWNKLPPDLRSAAAVSTFKNNSEPFYSCRLTVNNGVCACVCVLNKRK